MKINHNMPALRALRQLNKSEAKISDSLFKLSSGNRINRSSDDAAGLAIAHKLKMQLNGLAQSSNNAWDGISLIQTAEGAMNEIHAMLQRMNELSVQAANDSYILEDRVNLQKEIDQLKQEISRVASSLDFNGVKILNGELDLMPMVTQKTKLEVIFMHESTQAGKYGLKVDALATKAKLAGGAFPGAADTFDAEGGLTLNGQFFQYKKGELKREALDRLKMFAGDLGISLGIEAGNFYFERQEFGAKNIKIEGRAEELAALNLTASEAVGLDVSASLNLVNTDFPTGSTIKTEGNQVFITGADGFLIKLEIKGKALVGDNLSFELLKEGPMILQIGANKGHTMAVRIPNLSAKAVGVQEVYVRTREEAGQSIGFISEAIVLISSIRSKLGAYQNRLEYTIANIDTSNLNMTEAHSRIMHIDMSVEMTEYTKQNVIQQAATALLAQANQKPQEMLQLLR